MMLVDNSAFSQPLFRLKNKWSLARIIPSSNVLKYWSNWYRRTNDFQFNGTNAKMEWECAKKSGDNSNFGNQKSINNNFFKTKFNKQIFSGYKPGTASIWNFQAMPITARNRCVTRTEIFRPNHGSNVSRGS